MPLNESLEAEALRVLQSDTCLCGSGKYAGAAFCGACYFALPIEMRRALWDLQGFPEAKVYPTYATIWDDARTWLLANTTRLTRPSA